MSSPLNRVKRYYNSTSFDYRVLWTDSKSLAIHFGYYDQTVKNHSQALLKTNEILAKYALIKSTDSVLDAGCGLGGSAIWLAKNIGCKVTGVTIVPYQVKTARKFVKKYNVTDKVAIANADLCHTNFLSQSFNVVWALESVVHVEDKSKFITEAYRLLKRGAGLLLQNIC